MRRGAVFAGVGGIAFGVLTVVALAVENPPGGTYAVSDSVHYVAKGHRVAVLVSVYLALLAVLGLILLLAYLRDAISVLPEKHHLARIFWATGLTAAASFAVGIVIEATAALAHLYGGHHLVVAPNITYLISETGAVVFLGCGGILMGFSLIALIVGSGATLPGWLRGVTLIAGLGGIASLAFFPFFLVVIWAIVIGVWLLAAGRGPSRPQARDGTSSRERLA